MEIFTDLEQNTPEWRKLRAGYVTASPMHKVLAKGEGKTRMAYMYQLIGERFTGEPTEHYTNEHTDRGHEQEPKAKELYLMRNDEVKVKKVAFIRNFQEIGWVGYSPDLVANNDGLVEAKSRLAHIQAELLYKNEIPTSVKPQLQTGLWVSERDWIDYVSYCPGMPLFVRRAYRDEKYIMNLATETKRFYDEMNEIIESISKR